MMQDLDEIENQERILQNYKTRNGHDPMNTDMNFGEDQAGLADDPEVMLTGSRQFYAQSQRLYRQGGGATRKLVASTRRS